MATSVSYRPAVRRFAAAAFAFAVIAAGAGLPSSALAKKPAAPKMVETNPKRDAQLKAYLQKHFKIPKLEWIKFGPASETAIPGLYEREVTVTNGEGQSVSTKIFVDKDQTEAILGRVLDLKADPWGRVDVSKMHLKDRPVLGPASAPVTLIEFADFECPYCAHAFSGVETAVNNTYQGKVKLIFKNYPLNMHPWALKAAEAAECARMQNPDAFWSFARYFYSNQNKIKPENLQDNVDKLAADSKLDDKALRACMESPQTAARIKQDQDDGALGKVNSTPTFFIDGIPLVGLPEGDAFKFVLDSELARKK